MITVEEALAHVFALLKPLDAETVDFRKAAGRVLANPVTAKRAQPPFPASIMDGYGVGNASVQPGDRFTVIGEASAGHRFEGKIAQNEAIRIFTGAPVPQGVERVIIQEDITRDADVITLNRNPDKRLYIRELGADFKVGDALDSPARLTPAHIALLAAMNAPSVDVIRHPVVALIATGDELVPPGDTPGPDHIITSNTYGLAALVEAAGGSPRILPIARDTETSLNAVIDLAVQADLIVTIGGASVGDHDLVGKVAASRGLNRAFYKVAMRPGKPLMAGTLEGVPMIGLPGNPVSSMVCGEIFLRPAIDVMLGLPARKRTRRRVPLAAPVGANGPREHYMRATASAEAVTAFDRQDSALLSILSQANALVVRAPNDPERKTGEIVEVIDL